MPEDTNLQLSHPFLNVIVRSCNLKIVYIIPCLLNANENVRDSKEFYELETIQTQIPVSDPAWSTHHFINGSSKFAKDVWAINRNL